MNIYRGGSRDTISIEVKYKEVYIFGTADSFQVQVRREKDEQRNVHEITQASFVSHLATAHLSAAWPELLTPKLGPKCSHSFRNAAKAAAFSKRRKTRLNEEGNGEVDFNVRAYEWANLRRSSPQLKARKSLFLSTVFRTRVVQGLLQYDSRMRTACF